MTDDLLSIDEVAFAPPFPNPAPTDAPGELAWIEVSDLRIDPKYQRPVGPKGESNIKQVIENFSWSLFSPLVVCRRPGGLYAVIDGQHRAIAARTHGGIHKVPALIINGDITDEAKAFSVINGAVTAISETQLWHARVMSGDVDAIRLSRVFEKVGVTIPRSSKSAANMVKGETVAIAALQRAFKQYGGDAVGLALRTVVDTKDGNPGYIRGPLIKATAAVLFANPAWLANPNGVLHAVRQVGIKYLVDMADRWKENGAKSLFDAYSTEFTNCLKKGIK